MSEGASIAVVLLLVGWAIWGVLAWPPLKRALAAGDRAALLREYRQTIIGQLVLAALAIGAAVWAGLAIWSAPDELAIGTAVPVGELPVPILAGAGAALVGSIVGVCRRSSLGKGDAADRGHRGTRAGRASKPGDQRPAAFRAAKATASKTGENGGA